MPAVDPRPPRPVATNPTSSPCAGAHTTAPTQISSPFALDFVPGGRLGRLLFQLTAPALARAFALPDLQRIYDSLPPRAAPPDFCARALDALGVRCNVPDADLRRIPASGPLVVIANHPFGALDGLVLLHLLQRVRPDVRLLANFLLHRIPELRPLIISVDPFAGPDAPAQNASALRTAIRWLRDGGALGLFPAGEVAHWRFRTARVDESPWPDALARILRHARAVVVPLFFAGRNSDLFQLAGLVHPRLRTALLPRELLNKRRSSVDVRIGAAIPPARLARFESSAELTDYLRIRTLVLRARARPASPPAAEPAAQRPARAAPRIDQPVIDPVAPDVLAREIAALPAGRVLVESRDSLVLCAPADEIPALLREIGRLREITFRQVGEGTGRSIDLDRFDPHYLHLALWNRAESRLIGAYRLGPTDRLLPRFGLDGLYTHTLFRLDRRLLDRLGPAVELGRSFVVADAQRSYAPLLLLWKGIGRFVCDHPRYRVLFGAVSISADYDAMTRRLLMAFLRQNCADADLAALARPRCPPRDPRLRRDEARLLATAVRCIDDVNDLVADIEADRRGVPILLRQYLRLNARLLGFNIDPDFGDVLDGLFYVDLTAVARPILDRYMGPAAAAFLAAHRPGEAALGGRSCRHGDSPTR